MAAGPRDTSNLVMLTGWDATELHKFKLQDGTTYDAVYASLNAALAALNSEFASDGFTNLYSVTDQPTVSYRVGSSNGFSTHTEYARPDPQRAATEGHMLPLEGHDRMLGWTWDYLRKARMDQIQADIADAIKDARDRRRKRLLRRVLKRGDDSGAALELGSGGYSPGFATDEGSTSVDFDPPNYGGTSFDNTHEHYVGITGSLFTNALFTDALAELREHGHEPPYEFICGPSDESTIEGLSNFTPVPEGLVKYGLTQDLAKLGGGADAVGSYHIGTISNFAVRVVRGMPQYYGFGWKSYGARSQRNPLRVRLGKGESAWRVVAMKDPHSPTGQLPIQHMMLFMEFGVGVADRTNGTARYTVSGTWADGTAT